MIFSSHLFLYYFLPLLLAGYYALAWSPQRWRNGWLIFTGYLFYGWAEPRFVPLMFLTTFVDWLVSLAIAGDTWRVWRVWQQPVVPLPRGGLRTLRQKRALALSVSLNLVTLGFFKYFNFGLDCYNGAAHLAGADILQWHSALRVVLPLGISFYTFQALSYTIDVYRGEAEAMANFLDFSCFVSMVPHLVAGPILKFSFLADQLRHRTLTADKFARGVVFFLLGLAKKILLANSCGKVADLAFNAGSLQALDAWAGAVAYAFEIYFDFSGYSDMAIGLGLMLGFVFTKNFDAPYHAESITDFWRRWHISLSTWLREYLYIPLGGNQRGRIRTGLNLFATMFLGGLWHGASWNYAIWGGLHGGLLVLERRFGHESFYRALPRRLRVLLTFGLVLCGWVFFRAATLPAAAHYLQAMAGCGQPAPAAALLGPLWRQPCYLLSLAIAGAVIWKGRQTWDWSQQISPGKIAITFVLGWLALVILATQEYNPFIYFIF